MLGKVNKSLLEDAVKTKQVTRSAADDPFYRD
jgi:hypothetical protein